MGLVRTLRAAGRQWQADRASYLGAALAYYSLFSVAPLLLIAIAIAGLVFGEEAARGHLVDYLADYVGRDAAAGIQALVVKARHPTQSFWAAAFGGGVLLFAALNLFLQLKTALHLIWKLPTGPGQGLLHSTAKDYLLALAMVLITGLFVVLLLASGAALTVIKRWELDLPGGPLAWRAANFAATFLLHTLLLVMTFRILSDGQIAYRHLIGGALTAALLFTLGKVLFAYYLHYTDLGTAYGAAGSLVVFLVWVYYSAQMLFFGAEVVAVRAGRV